jgi:type IV pilus assembly protein PilB
MPSMTTPSAGSQERRAGHDAGLNIPGGCRLFSEILLSSSLLNRNELHAAIEHAEHERMPLFDAIVDLGLVTDVDSYAALAQATGIPLIDLNDVTVSPLALRLVPEKVCRRHTLVPLHQDNRTLTYAIARPYDDEAERDVGFASGRQGRAVLATRAQVLAALERCHPHGTDIERLVARLRGAVEVKAFDSIAMTLDPDSPIVALCNQIITGAVEAHASDVHVEPFPDRAVVRYRVSGLLEPVVTVPKEAVPHMVNRFKVMARVNIAMRHQPQDGSFRVTVHDRPVDIRLSTLPTIHGEKVVMRVINSASDLQTLDKLGYDQDTLDRLKQVLGRPDGLILFTGPTASGKTTALYAALNHLRTGRTNIVSVEDPVERLIDGVNQIPVNNRGTSFANVLRSVLRQDPNIIMVGEVRDAEVAQIVGQAAYTGHLVLSSLHTIDAASAVTRLRNLGLEPFRIAESLAAVFAQRLIRRLCPDCHVLIPPDEAERLGDANGIRWVPTQAGPGCPRCKQTGYIERVPVAEALVPDEGLRAAIRDGAGVRELRAAMRAAGCRTMRDTALDMVEQGLTSIEEVNRVLSADTEPQPAFGARGEREAAEIGPREPAPVVEPDEPVTTRRSRTRAAPHILIVDDDKMIRMLVKRLLAKEGYEVIEGENGQQAIDLAREHRPDLLLMDLVMPEMNGYEAIGRIRQDPGLAGLPVMILTAEAGAKSEQRVLELGADDYLVKPFDPPVLLLRVRAMFRRMQRLAA